MCKYLVANIHDMDGAEELLEHVHGWVLGDRKYWDPEACERLRQNDLWLLAPYKSAKREKQPFPFYLMQVR